MCARDVHSPRYDFGQGERVGLQGLGRLREEEKDNNETLKYSIYSIITAGRRGVITYPNIMQGTDSDPGLKPIPCCPDFLRDAGFHWSQLPPVSHIKAILLYTINGHRRSAKLLNNISHSMLVSAAQN